MLPDSSEIYTPQPMVGLRAEDLETLSISTFNRFAPQKFGYLQVVNTLITHWIEQKRPNLLIDSFLAELSPTIVHHSLAYHRLLGSSVVKNDFNDMPADYYFDKKSGIFRPTSDIQIPGICMQYLQTQEGDPLPVYKK